MIYPLPPPPPLPLLQMDNRASRDEEYLALFLAYHRPRLCKDPPRCCDLRTQNDWERMSCEEKHTFSHLVFDSILDKLAVPKDEYSECQECGKITGDPENAKAEWPEGAPNTALEDRLCVWESLTLAEKLEALE